MHHRKKGRKLNRKRSNYIAMFRNMAVSLIYYEYIKTTLAKAKELRRVIEPIITKSKIDTIKNRRIIFSILRDNYIVSKLFNHIGNRFLNRSGGYTRILKCGFRVGDNAPMAYIELVNRLPNIIHDN